MDRDSDEQGSAQVIELRPDPEGAGDQYTGGSDERDDERSEEGEPERQSNVIRIDRRIPPDTVA